MISLRFSLLFQIFRLRPRMLSLSRTHPGSHQGATLGALLLYTLHRIPIPIVCDNSYQAELYVAWVVLRARASAHWFVRDDRWSLNDSNSYITALGSRNHGTSPLVTSLLVACRSLVRNTAPLQNLYSHLTGTFLDRVMDAVDDLAREVGMSQTPWYGWIPELQELPVLFTRNERQVQDFQAFLKKKKISTCVLHHLQIPYHPRSPNLLLYERVVMTGAIKWGYPSTNSCHKTGPLQPPYGNHLLHVRGHCHPTALYSRLPAFGFLPHCYTRPTCYGYR